MRAPRAEGPQAVTTHRMSRRALLWGGLLAAGATLAQALVSGATTLVAQAPPPQPARPPGGAPPPAQISLAQAVRSAEKETGGRGRKAELEREKGIYVYEIKTIAMDRSAKVLIDPPSGNVVRVDTPGIISAIGNVFDRDDQRKDQAALARLEASSMTLAGAIESAEKETGGRAIKAALRDRYGATLFEVRVVKDWIAHQVLVDPATGKVVTVPAPAKRKDDDD